MYHAKFLTAQMCAIAVVLAGPWLLMAQETPAPGRGANAQPGRGGRGPQVVSPEVLPDRHVVFRVVAPNAQSVGLSGSDLPRTVFPPTPDQGQTGGQAGFGRGGTPLKKGDNNVWELTIGPVDPGAYRYTLNIDGVGVLDPRNTSVSESNANLSSLLYVPGADFMDTKDVPHGAVASVTYYSKTLKKFRRMHVYSPPGYDAGAKKYPVFYLLHGAGDCDDSWTSAGRAGFILDNLIAAGKAKPMVVVMPAGHTSQATGGRGAAPADAPRRPQFDDEFVQDFVNEIMPYVESNYRIQADRAHRAIAGLSMGGAHTLYIAIPHLDKFAYIGVFSSGLIGMVPGGGRGRGGAPAEPAPPAAAPAAPSPLLLAWEEQNKAMLDNPALKKGLKVFWFSTGKEDFTVNEAVSKASADFFQKHGLDAAFEESPGGHTWINWREYLNKFAPRLFQ